MNETKHWYESKVVWSSVISAIAGLAGLTIPVELQSQLVDLTIKGVEIAGALAAAYFRTRSTAKIAPAA